MTIVPLIPDGLLWAVLALAIIGFAVVEFLLNRPPRVDRKPLWA